MVNKNQILSALENIYISPAEICNLNCRLCYTNKTKNILSIDQILSFVNTYGKIIKLKSILFCGGEVFILPEFTDLINTLTKKNIFITIITNGTVDKLKEIKDPSNCQLLVSLDGPKEIHDQNRSIGNFDKSINFIKHARELGFPVEVMFLVTPESYPFKDSFPQYLDKLFNLKNLQLNYITQKTFFYTDNHPLSNQNNKKTALTPDQIIDIKKNYPSIPGKSFGCFQLTLQSNGLIYGCCESPISIGKIDDNPKTYINKFVESLSVCQKCTLNQAKADADNIFRSGTCLPAGRSSERSEGVSTSKKSLSSRQICKGCCCPDFLCGYKKELNQKDCKGVVKLFHS